MAQPTPSERTVIDATQHKADLRSYFDGVGFERWTAIYGEKLPLSRVRQSIRTGHTRMLAQALAWLHESLPQPEMTVLDVGCGTGLATLALAQQGLTVTAVDIAPNMVAATLEQAYAARLLKRVHGLIGEVEQVGGQFDAVVCLDVLVHYPAASFADLCRQLVAHSRGPVVFTYAPRTPLLAALHWIGGRFPRTQRRTEIQMQPEPFVRRTLAEAGMQIRRSVPINHGFYHVTLLEAVPAG